MDDTLQEGGAEQAIVPVREAVVDFYGDHILAGQTADGRVYIPLRPLTDFLGLDDRSQRHRVRRDPVLAPEVQLLYKSKSLRPRDEHDFANTLPLLNQERREWLAAALVLTRSDHPWLLLLREAKAGFTRPT